ncbi:MAG: murein L,D-transpeptidase YcbB/YkuD, partial [Bradymonadia bacterium]
MIEEGRLDFETDPAIRELVTLLFAERGYEHLFVYGTHLTPDGRALVEALLGATREGLALADLHAAAIEERVGTLAAAGDIDDIVNALQLSVEDESALLAFMMNEAALDGTLPAADAVFSLIAEDSSDNPVPRYSTAIQDLSSRLASAAEAAPELELVLAAGFLRYAIRNHHSNLGYVTDEFSLSHGWGDVEDHREEAERTLAGASFRNALSTGFAAEIAQLSPPFSEYDELVAALADYRGYVNAGGWEALPTTRLEPGETDDAVPALRRRLAAEDYFDGDLESTHFDAELEAAVEWYQRTHQLVQNGEVADGTLWSLNVLAERRVSQILVALDKWRETPLAPDAEGEFIWVNIPEFYAELRDGRELIYRWKVVVGRERGGRDSLGNPRGQTPRFSDSLEYIVFNPYWNVPSQIREEEYDPLIAADPNWLIDNGFEIAVDGSREWLRQMPGSGNALGQVKFLFPNQHDV